MDRAAAAAAWREIEDLAVDHGIVAEPGGFGPGDREPAGQDRAPVRSGPRGAAGGGHHGGTGLVRRRTTRPTDGACRGSGGIRQRPGPATAWPGNGADRHELDRHARPLGRRRTASAGVGVGSTAFRCRRWTGWCRAPSGRPGGGTESHCDEHRRGDGQARRRSTRSMTCRRAARSARGAITRVTEITGATARDPRRSRRSGTNWRSSRRGRAAATTAAKAASRADGPGWLTCRQDWAYWPGSSKRRRKRSSIRLPNDGFDFAASLAAPFAARAPG